MCYSPPIFSRTGQTEETNCRLFLLFILEVLHLSHRSNNEGGHPPSPNSLWYLKTHKMPLHPSLQKNIHSKWPTLHSTWILIIWGTLHFQRILVRAHLHPPKSTNLLVYTVKLSKADHLQIFLSNVGQVNHTKNS